MVSLLTYLIYLILFSTRLDLTPLFSPLKMLCSQILVCKHFVQCFQKNDRIIHNVFNILNHEEHLLFPQIKNSKIFMDLKQACGIQKLNKRLIKAFHPVHLASSK